MLGTVSEGSSRDLTFAERETTFEDMVSFALAALR